MGAPKGSGLIDLSNKIVGKLTVLYRDGTNDSKDPLWFCLCECGNTCLKPGGDLRKGKAKSCGCYKRGTYPGEAGLNALYHDYEVSAKERGLIFSLSKGEAAIFFKGLCHYCGSLPQQVKTSSTERGSYQYNGIDRVDNQQGYHGENCVSCCSTCNYMKRDLSIKDFIAHLKRIVTRLGC